MTSVDTRLTLDARAISCMVVLCLLWSLQQISLKAVALDFSPMLHIALRSGLSAVLVALYMRWRGQPLHEADGLWKPGMVVGALFALEYLAVGAGLQYTSAAHMLVFLYAAPIFAALGLHWKLPTERLAPLQWVGILMAFCGIATAFLLRDNAQAAGDVGRMLWGDFLGLIGAAAWGATTVVIRCTGLSGMAPARTLLYQLLGAFVLLVPCALWLGQARLNPTALVLAHLSFQAVIVSFAGFLVWFWLLRTYLASQLGVFTFMTPLFGVLLGAWLLHEPIEPAFLGGALLVLTGIVLVSGYSWIQQGLAALRARA